MSLIIKIINKRWSDLSFGLVHITIHIEDKTDRSSTMTCLNVHRSLGKKNHQLLGVYDLSHLKLNFAKKNTSSFRKPVGSTSLKNPTRLLESHGDKTKHQIQNK